jgi:hypothetical protein
MLKTQMTHHIGAAPLFISCVNHDGSIMTHAEYVTHDTGAAPLITFCLDRTTLAGQPAPAGHNTHGASPLHLLDPASRMLFTCSQKT